MNVKSLADDDDCIEEETGTPMLWASQGAIARTPFKEALGVWVGCQDDGVTIDQAALAFKATREVIIEAVGDHYWLFLDGEKIEQEGA